MEKVYDNLDFMRGVDVFLPTAAVQHQPENSAVSYQLSFLLLAHSVTCETSATPIQTFHSRLTFSRTSIVYPRLKFFC